MTSYESFRRIGAVVEEQWLGGGGVVRARSLSCPKAVRGDARVSVTDGHFHLHYTDDHRRATSRVQNGCLHAALVTNVRARPLMEMLLQPGVLNLA